jgi:tetrahydromethanopterin S-methyltransferase subunit A
MDSHPDLDIALSELKAGIDLPKCQQCGCMSETLQQIGKAFALLPPDSAPEIQDALSQWVEKMTSIRYTCLGCEHCYAGVAQNAFVSTFPEIDIQLELSCEIKTNTASWPPVVGEYLVLDSSAPVAVTTLASTDLARQLADEKIPGLAIVGRLETENIGIDKIIKNTIANPNLRYLIVTGTDPKGHLCGQTLLALSENGVDANGRVIGSNGKRPILQNVSQAEIEAFRQQIQMINLIGCECIECVSEKVTALRDQTLVQASEPVSCGCIDGSCHTPETKTIRTVVVEETDEAVKLDKAGYFVILPIADRRVIHVEHYSYDNSLLHVLEGTSARSLYLKIIEQNWVSEMSHAAYLGKELAKAQLNLNFGIPYTQDAA